jgi:hypothetical protein
MDSDIKHIYRQVEGEFKDIFASISNKGKLLNKKYTSLSEKVDILLKNKCKNQYEWVVSNYDKIKKEQVNMDKLQKAELQKKYDELNDCFAKHNVGTQELINEYQGKNDQLQKFELDLAQDCRKCSSSNSEEELKSCFRSAIANMTTKINLLFENYNKKFDEVDKSL